jgi:predicted O-linked N-acetylglucosamine transferase (SPINDLY family)
MADARYDPRNVAKIDAVRQLLVQGKLDAARAGALRLAQASPRDVNVAQLAGECAILCGLQDQAFHYISRARELDPDNPDVLVNWARTARLMDRREDAVAALERACTLAPQWPLAHTELGALLLDLGRPIDAIEVCRRAAERMPTDVSLRSLLAACDLARGDAEGALRGAEAALACAPEHALLLNGRALMGNYAHSVTRAQAFEHHRAYGRVIERDVAPREWNAPGAAASRPVPMRVGFVSPDLRRHSVAYFAEHLLAHRDPARVCTVVFQTNRIADDMTARLRGMADEWHVCDTVTDPELAELIAAAKIDVLFELSGHTHAHSLTAMAAKPAPVIVTYLGYPNTTGLARMDARIVDRWTDPDGDEFATEKLVRLDRCFVAFSPPVDAPEIVARDESRPITFGSFNAIQKLSDATVALWTRAVRAVPGARLVLKANALKDARLREDVRARFVDAGIASELLDVLEPVDDTRGHLAAYTHIDIGLDPFPYHGTTTTCEAMWMGVPVVSRVGEWHASRVGASLLHSVGLDDLACASDDAFVEACVGLARDRARLTRLRGVGEMGGDGSLRQRMSNSTLCDGAGLWRAIEGALIELHDAWRAGARN